MKESTTTKKRLKIILKIVWNVKKKSKAIIEYRKDMRLVI